MEILNNPYLIWFIIGFILLILEFIVPGLILVFFGSAAWIVALLLLVFDLSLNVQLLLFLVFSFAGVFLLRKYIRKKPVKPGSRDYSLEEEIIGRTGRAETNMAPQESGRVFLNGTSWMAINQGDKPIAAKQDVIVRGLKSITLMVELK